MSGQVRRVKRVILKLSGEMLAGDGGHGLDPFTVERYAREIIEVRNLGIEVGVVLGGGNIFRGFQGAAHGVDRVRGDQMGMLATVINCLAVHDMLQRLGCDSGVMTATPMPEIAEPYLVHRARAQLASGRVLLFGAGTGNPYFSTDTAAALRALELQADLLAKGTKVEGVFDRDPEKYPDAVLIRECSHADIIERGLRVIDLTAASLCLESKLPIVVFSLKEPGSLVRVVQGEPIGTRVI